MKFILTGDWQIRDDVPVCRTDDYQKEMFRKVQFIVDLAIDEKVNGILHSGDFFDRGRPVQSQLLEIAMMDILDSLKKKDIPLIVVPGNHDLPYHSMAEIGRSSFGVLEKTKHIQNVHDVELCLDDVLIRGTGWGFPYRTEEPKKSSDCIIEIWHGMVLYDGWLPGGIDANDLMKKMPWASLILTGHNHASFAVKGADQILVNPGGLLRESIDQIDYRPAVFLWDGKTVKRIDVPIQQGVISLEHKKIIEERDKKILAFVESMKMDYEIGLSFEKNLESHFRENPVDKAVEKLVWEVVG